MDEVLCAIKQFENAGIEEQEDVFKDLNLLIKVKFKKEEAAYEKVNYPDFKMHKQAHAEMVRTLMSFKTQFIDREIKNKEYTKDMIEFLNLWFDDHTSSMDSVADAYIRLEGFIKKHA